MSKTQTNELQKAIIKLYRFCQRREDCVTKSGRCVLLKDRYGCSIGKPAEWDISDLLLLNFDEETEEK